MNVSKKRQKMSLHAKPVAIMADNKENKNWHYAAGNLKVRKEKC